MNVLGLVDFAGSHNTSAALVCDGRLVAAAEEERFTRVKYQGGIALRAIDYCLSSAGLRMSDIDAIAFADLPFRTGRESPHAQTDAATLRKLREAGQVRYRSLVHKRAMDTAGKLGLSWAGRFMSPAAAAVLRELVRRFGPLPPLRYYDHHRCHAATAFLTSPFDEAVALTVDCRGGNYASSIWRGRGLGLERVGGEPFTNSLGNFYSSCTEYVGLGEYGEGKMMGLASYGDADAMRHEVALMLDTSGSAPYVYRHPPNESIAGFPSGRSDVMSPEVRNFAASVQAGLETAMDRLAAAAVLQVGSRNLCLGGGVALNCSANGTLLDAGAADAHWLFPPCGDAGLSVGAALLCSAEVGDLSREAVQHAYWGPESNAAECERALRAESAITYRSLRDPATETSALLADGLVIGWFQGRMEIGPRALGHRSILADPRSTVTRDRVNQIKGREAWRPLAPMVLKERAHEYFERTPPSEFMLFAVQVRPEKRAQLAGVVHVDGSARPQLVARAREERLHSLLSAFSDRTGVPVLLNTSFNLADEPIVCTPTDAIRTFLASDLDALVLGDFLVRRAGP